MDSVGLTQAPTTAEPPTRSRGFSFKSDQSGASKGSKPREDPTESSLDKQRRDTFLQSSKANPNAAFYEAQPAGRSDSFHSMLLLLPLLLALYLSSVTFHPVISPLARYRDGLSLCAASVVILHCSV
jgi:hypothetical protein